MWYFVSTWAAQEYNHSINTWQLHGARGSGRPKASWADAINSFLTQPLDTAHTNADWHKVATDAVKWNSLAEDFTIATDLGTDTSKEDDDENEERPAAH